MVLCCSSTIHLRPILDEVNLDVLNFKGCQTLRTLFMINTNLLVGSWIFDSAASIHSLQILANKLLDGDTGYRHIYIVKISPQHLAITVIYELSENTRVIFDEYVSRTATYIATQTDMLIDWSIGTCLGVARSHHNSSLPM